jgi:hypothetical protein
VQSSDAKGVPGFVWYESWFKILVCLPPKPGCLKRWARTPEPPSAPTAAVAATCGPAQLLKRAQALTHQPCQAKNQENQRTQRHNGTNGQSLLHDWPSMSRETCSTQWGGRLSAAFKTSRWVDSASAKSEHMYLVTGGCNHGYLTPHRVCRAVKVSQDKVPMLSHSTGRRSTYHQTESVFHLQPNHVIR